MDYEQLLKKAKEELPKIEVSKERFVIPTVKGHIEGNKTIILNFNSICDLLRAEQDKMLKYLQKELATPAVLQNGRLIFGRKLTSKFINQKIEQYAYDYVLCKECGKPDTVVEKQDRFMFLKCTACGARQPIKSRI